MSGDHECSRGDQSKTERLAEPPAPGRVLLDRHDRTQHQHPTDIAGANDKHQEHDRPATTDTEQPVMQAELKRIAPWRDALPVLDDEAQRCAAFVKTAIFQLAELEKAGNGEKTGAKAPGIHDEPFRSSSDNVQGRIQPMT